VGGWGGIGTATYLYFKGGQHCESKLFFLVGCMLRWLGDEWYGMDYVKEFYLLHDIFRLTDYTR